MVNYHDYGSTSTTTTTGGNTWLDTCTTGTSTTNWYYSTVQVVKKYLVGCPENWGQDIIDAFCRLINDETATGFHINMIINGDIKIIDPNIEVRDMDSFRMLVRSYASGDDTKKINAFFDANPIGKGESD